MECRKAPIPTARVRCPSSGSAPGRSVSHAFPLRLSLTLTAYPRVAPTRTSTQRSLVSVFSLSHGAEAPPFRGGVSAVLSFVRYSALGRRHSGLPERDRSPALVLFQLHGRGVPAEQPLLGKTFAVHALGSACRVRTGHCSDGPTVSVDAAKAVSPGTCVAAEARHKPLAFAMGCLTISVASNRRPACDPAHTPACPALCPCRASTGHQVDAIPVAARLPLVLPVSRQLRFAPYGNLTP
jgi:hypothetical protein